MEAYAAQIQAEYVKELKYEEVDIDAIIHAKKCFADWLAVTISGSNSLEGELVVNYTKALQGKPEATILGAGFKASCENVALTHGTFAHSQDYDDTQLDCAVHVGAVVFSAVFALAEAKKISGKDFMAAVVSGYEIAARVGMAINLLPQKAHHRKGFHPTGTVGVFGAAAAAGRALGLEAKEITNALGIAGSCAGGLMEYMQNGSMVKRLHPGIAASQGIKAALLAREGFTGPESVYEGKDGFLKAYSNEGEYDFKWLTYKIGEEYYIKRTALKYYACCHHIHSALDAVFEVLNNVKITVDQIKAIKVYNPMPAHCLVGEPLEQKYNPQTVTGAQMSLPYSLAVGLIDGKVTVEQFTPEKFNNKIINDLTRKIKPYVDHDLDNQFFPDKWPTKVVIETDTKVFENRVDSPKGFPDKPMTDEELKFKFINLTSSIIGEKEAQALFEKAGNIEKYNDVSEIIPNIATC